MSSKALAERDATSAQNRQSCIQIAAGQSATVHLLRPRAGDDHQGQHRHPGAADETFQPQTSSSRVWRSVTSPSSIKSLKRKFTHAYLAATLRLGRTR
eukprot:6209062-Pleurochrysis_carterae.AAC.1